MSTGLRWVVAVAAAVLVVCLLIWARGVAHHHGDEIGSLGAGVSAPATTGGLSG